MMRMLCRIVLVPGSGHRSRLAISLLALLALAPRALAQCDCSDGDGRFTTHTAIVIDGNRADWASILGILQQLLRRRLTEHPTPAGPRRTGAIHGARPPPLRLHRDDAYVATLTGRVASSSNVQKFIYYADTNNNGLMETGERVVVATWQGSNRNVDLFLGRYAASQPGDPW